MQSPTNSEEKVEGNPIGSLQEMCAAWGCPLPIYNLVSEIGLPHAKEFTIECKILQRREIGKGKTKQLAKQTAAHKMWIGIQKRPLNRIEVSKILNKEQIQKGKMARLTTKAMSPPNNSTGRKNRKNFLAAKNAQEPKNYVPKDFSTKSKTKTGPSANSSIELTGGTFSKFGDDNHISVKARPIVATSVKNKSDTISVDNNISKSLKNLCLTNEIQRYPEKATLDKLNEKENIKQVGGTTRKTSTSKSKNLSTYNGEELKRISLQEVCFYSERKVPFKAMGAEFFKREMTPSKDLIAKPISKEQSSEVPMKNKTNNYKKVVTSNPIGHLQEMCVARGWPVPAYRTKSEFGLFIVECKILQHRETGRGNDKKYAKKLAAHKMWSKLEEHSLDTK